MLLVRLLSRLPFWILYIISDFLFFITYYIVGYRRKMVQKNLRNSFPEKSEKEIRKIEKQFYINLCDYGVETLKLFSIPKAELAKRMLFKDISIIEKYKAQNQSVVILASHQFNWEWLLSSGNFNLPVPVDFVYQHQSSEFFNRFSLMCRTRFGAHAIGRHDVARELIRRKNILRGIAIVSDQYPGLKKDKKYQTRFLNQDTVFFLGAHQIAILTQYPVVYAQVKKIRRGYYEASFVPIAEPPYTREDFTLIENYIKSVESVIHENPAGWLWSHNRWKTRHLKKD
ncbi:lysophospholipid acyltransferase family protein [Ohtaekwangia koreensis]|uniref:KDO2-lipid IV(A) lauroyltransferase n=1 Tax=Ohtaekwangia koreensis TaxID=688867 RepID=A0A1T5LF68_9BACT|nr:lysophospholipid acyltransferase family protein [Ohtaekwangia koreensis]SKC74697.1 KDO2-lipid IV(A) lauroyltransferase [Ohtaekwangia koreensis]